MKKALSLILAVSLLLALLSSCGTAASAPAVGPTTDNVTLRIGGLAGPTSIGMVQLMQTNEAGTAGQKYNFQIAGSADELTPLLVKGDLDLAAVPANLASVLYNNTSGKVQVVAVNTLGVLYLLEKGGNTVTSIASLKGKTIYATGQGSIPEYTLRYLLKANGIDPDKDVTIQWKSEPAEVVSALNSQKTGIAMLPQPYVTVACSQMKDLRIAVDLTKEWDALGTGSSLVTGVMVVRKDFAQEHPAAVAKFLEEYQSSIAYVTAHVDEASQMTEHFGIVKAAVAKQAIPYCNLTFLSGTQMKQTLSGYLEVLYEQNPKAIGGTLPSDDFYYGA